MDIKARYEVRVRGEEEVLIETRVGSAIARPAPQPVNQPSALTCPQSMYHSL